MQTPCDQKTKSPKKIRPVPPYAAIPATWTCSFPTLRFHEKECHLKKQTKQIKNPNWIIKNQNQTIDNHSIGLHSAVYTITLNKKTKQKTDSKIL